MQDPGPSAAGATPPCAARARGPGPTDQRYPEGNPAIDCVAHNRCRFVSRSGQPVAFDDALSLARRVNETHEVCHVGRLLSIDGSDGFTKAQGED
ncbi:MAG: hypothetical protein ACKOCW_13415 [Planctomycetaceae bacterium]